MDKLGSYRISKPVGWLLLYLLPVAAGLGLLVFLTNIAIFFSPSAHDLGTAVRGITPLAYLGLPGINPYLPIFDGWAALIVAMVVHEGAHGVVARSLGFPVKSSGLLFFLILPIGAFVEVDEEALKAAKARDSGRILAAGASVNLVLGVACLIALLGIISTMSPAVNGLGITTVTLDSPAATAGVVPGDFLISVNGVHYNDRASLVNSSWYQPGQHISMIFWRDGSTYQRNLTLGNNPNNATVAYIGVQSVDYAELSARVADYTGAWKSPITGWKAIGYLCIPTFPRCQGIVPFSDQLALFYISPYGASLVPVTNLFFWFFFLNFNLAVFNALPIYPLDGGQAFRAGLKGLAGERLSEKSITRITNAATITVLAIIASFPVAAYLGLV